MTTTLLSASTSRGRARLHLDRPAVPPEPHPFLQFLVRPARVENAPGTLFDTQAEAERAAVEYTRSDRRDHYVVVVAREV